MEELVTIATFSTVTQAYVIKARLQAEGIPCRLHDVNINTLMPTSSFGGVKLQVPLHLSREAVDIYYEIGRDLGTLEI